MASLQSCPSCNTACRKVHNITADDVQTWLPEANRAGRKHGINPAVFLAVAVVETDANPSASGGGMTQVTTDVLNAYNTMMRTNYTQADCRGLQVRAVMAMPSCSWPRLIAAGGLTRIQARLIPSTLEISTKCLSIRCRKTLGCTDRKEDLVGTHKIKVRSHTLKAEE